MYSSHGESLAASLNKSPVYELKVLAKSLDIGRKVPLKKADIIKVITEHLTTENLKKYWKKMDTLQQNAIAETVHVGQGIFERSRFMTKYKAKPSWIMLRRSDREPDSNRVNLMAVFFNENVLPYELYDGFKSFVPDPSKNTPLGFVDNLPKERNVERTQYDYKSEKYVRNIEKIPFYQRDTERSALSELRIVLRLIEIGKISVSDKAKMPTTASIRKVSEMLKDGDFYSFIENDEKKSVQEELGDMKSFAWPILLQTGGFARPSGSKLKLTRDGKEALAGDPVHAIRWIVNRLGSEKGFDEFRRIDEIKGQTGRGKGHFIDPRYRRISILGALKDCPTNEWVDVDDLLRYIQISEHDFLVSDCLWGLYICDPEYGSLGYAGFGEWEVVQGRYTLCFLFEYLATLGLIDVAYTTPFHVREDYWENWGTDDLEYLSRYDGLGYFRINDLGKHCLGLVDHYKAKAIEKEEGGGTFKILPNLEIVSTGRLGEVDKVVLDYYAKKKTEHMWVLDKTKILINVEGGHSLDEISEFFSSKSENGFPQTVEVFFEDLKKRINAIKMVGETKLIECRDKTLALLLANDSSLKKICYFAGEKHIVYMAKNEKRFFNALRKLGYILT